MYMYSRLFTSFLTIDAVLRVEEDILAATKLGLSVATVESHDYSANNRNLSCRNGAVSLQRPSEKRDVRWLKLDSFSMMIAKLKRSQTLKPVRSPA